MFRVFRARTSDPVRSTVFIFRQQFLQHDQNKDLLIRRTSLISLFRIKHTNVGLIC